MIVYKLKGICLFVLVIAFAAYLLGLIGDADYYHLYLSVLWMFVGLVGIYLCEKVHD